MASPLYVPVQLQALLVNPAVRAQGFQRWTMDYSALASYGSPEPAPFAGTDPNWADSPADDGIHLQWTLPSALRRGVHDAATGATTYPLVPNRWAVVRSWGPGNPNPGQRRESTAWIVESDYLGPDGSAAYLDPGASQPSPIKLGRTLPLPGWRENRRGPQFLTAIAPGNVAFAAYQPYSAGVFSFFDQATNISEGQLVSYLVFGWFSDPGSDILAPANQSAGLAARLADLSWTVQGTETALSTLFHGSIRGFAFSRGVVGTRPAATALAVGNTSIDAMTALVDKQAANRPGGASGTGRALNPSLLEAFQYDLLRTIDEVDGPAQLSAQIHEAWFGALPGGSVWQIVPVPPADSEQAAQQEDAEAAAAAGGPSAPADEPSWLEDLNAAQRSYDSTMRELTAAQRELYELWWKRGRADSLPVRPAGLTDAQFAAALDPAQPTSAAGRVAALTRQAAALRSSIPWGATQQALAAAITAFADRYELPANTELRRADLPAFRSAADPVVVIAGARAGAFNEDLGANTAGLLPCRFADQLVTALNVPQPPAPVIPQNPIFGTEPDPPLIHEPPLPPAAVTAQMLGGLLPAVNLSAIQPNATLLLAEDFLLDPANAPAVANLAASELSRPGRPAEPAQLLPGITQAMTLGQWLTGTAPAILPQPWTQPWAPLFLQWQAAYYPLPYGPAWQFDGTGYSWTGPASPGGPIQLSGRSLLMPQPSFTFKSRLDAYLAATPDADLTALESFMASVDGWDFLSQALSGFNAQLALRDAASLRAPDPITVVQAPHTTMADLVGPGATAMPMPNGAVPAIGQAVAGSGFQPLRAGQFCFTRVSVVDRFGQSIDVIGPQNAASFTPVVAAGLAPGGAVAGPAPATRYVQLPPRLLQPARLDAAFLPATAAPATAAPPAAALASPGAPAPDVRRPAATDPVCAWIVPSPLDAALACYAPDGTALGELSATATAAGGTEVSWLPAPGSTLHELSSLTPAFPVLAAFLGAIAAAGPAAFSDLLATIDATLWTIDPPGSGDEAYLSVLAGRPLALVRATLGGEPAGPERTDPSWQYTFAPEPSPLPDYTFQVRPGDASLRGDGLVGYFADPDYGHFRAAYRPAGLTSPYVEAIGPGFFVPINFGAAPVTITLLMDPRAPVHLVSDILPAATLRLSQRAVARSLAAIALSVRFGPVLADLLQPADAAAGPPAVVLPRPPQVDGTWSWAEQADSEQAGGPASLAVSPADSAARFPATPPTLRTGWLKLSGAFKPHEGAS